MYNLDIKTFLENLGYKHIKKISKTRYAVLTNENRVDVLEDLNSKIKNSYYNKTPTSTSSVGVLEFGEYKILAKPLAKQSGRSAGLDNEKILINNIKKFLSSGPINVIFKSSNENFTILGCNEILEVGTDTIGRKKADVILVDNNGNKFPISLKKDDAEIWESADKYYKNKAENIIDDLLKRNKILLKEVDSIFTITPNIATKATPQEKKSVIFGSDIEENGCVITKTFSSSSFKMKDDTLTIDCTNIIKKISDVKDYQEPYFLIRNDKTRKGLKYPGLRVLAVYKKRLNPKILII